MVRSPAVRMPTWGELIPEVPPPRRTWKMPSTVRHLHHGLWQRPVQSSRQRDAIPYKGLPHFASLQRLGIPGSKQRPMVG